MPYLIPEPAKNPLVDEIPIRGFCVYLPDDVGFISAFVGAYQFFTKWVAYERDSSLAGKRAAHMFQIAYDKTMESFYNEGCGGDMAFDCETMKECLIEVARAVSVNVTVNNSCGASSNTLYCVVDGGDVVVNPPPVTDDPVEPITTLPPGDELPPGLDPDTDPPPDDWETWEEYDLDACAAANTLVAWAEEATARCCEFFTQDVYGITAIFAFVVNMYYGSWSIILSGAFFLKLAELIRAVWDNTEAVVDLFCNLNTFITENKQDLVCELYQNRLDVPDWENILVQRLFEASEGGLVSLNSKPLWLDTLKYLLPGFSSVGVMLGSITYEGDASGFLSCANCDPAPDYWQFEYTTGFEGETELDVITNQPGDLEIECWLKAASDTGPFVFFAYIENVNVQPLGKIDVTFTPTLSPKTWFMQFYDATDGLLYTSDTLESGLTSIEFEGYSLTKRIVLHMTDAFYFEDPPHFDVRLQVSGLSVEV